MVDRWSPRQWLLMHVNIASIFLTDGSTGYCHAQPVETHRGARPLASGGDSDLPRRIAASRQPRSSRSSTVAARPLRETHADLPRRLHATRGDPVRDLARRASTKRSALSRICGTRPSSPLVAPRRTCLASPPRSRCGRFISPRVPVALALRQSGCRTAPCAALAARGPSPSSGRSYPGPGLVGAGRGPIGAPNPFARLVPRGYRRARRGAGDHAALDGGAREHAGRA